MRIFLAESDPELRVGLQFLIYQQPGHQVIGITDSGKGLKKQIKASKPDVLLLDWYLPGKAINELVRDIRALKLSMKIVVMSIYPEDEGEVLDTGVDHFITKESHPNEIIVLLRKMRLKTTNGESVLREGGDISDNSSE
jgi:DNA-binding response OmpR family regulator